MAVRVIDVRERVMAQNDSIAADVRRRLEDAGVPSLNLMSSPGAGKTLLLERTLAELASSLRIATIVGDVQTQNDADRLARHTTRLVQAVVTGGACHLDARQVSAALDAIDLDLDLAGCVAHPPIELVAHGEPMDERPEAHALNDAGHPHAATTSLGGRCHAMAPDLTRVAACTCARSS